MKKNHFTLLELLIIIAIIGILTTLLIPSLNKAREKARSAICKSNQSQIYKYTVLWSRDKNAWIPYGHSWHIYSMTNNFKHGSTDKWVAMGHMVKDGIVDVPDVFECPSCNKPARITKTFKKANNSNVTDFNFSPILQRFDLNTGNLREAEDASLLNNGDKVFLSMLDKEALSMDRFWSTQSYDNSHLTFSNVAFSSGHIKTVTHKSMSLRNTITSLSDGFNNTAQQMWKDLEDHY
ncbi:MAG: hypothetical protein MK132_25870 [Lentisphaerales bacterium]|nr:hypothetical protein [Lentisphaerales bacterium]